MIVAAAAASGIAWLLRPVPPAVALGPSRPTGIDPWTPTWQPGADDDCPLAALPDRHLPEVRFNANRLRDVIDYLADVTGARFNVDWPALAATGVTPDSQVTGCLRDLKCSTAFKLIAHSVQSPSDPIEFFPQGTCIAVTTRSVRAAHLITRQYDVASLLRDDAHGWRTEGVCPDERVADIEAWVVQYVAPDTWRWSGGVYGSIGIDPDRRVLTVVQTPEDQEAVADCLLWIRHTLVQESRAAQRGH